MGTLITAGLITHGQAATVDTAIQGSLGLSENTCVSPIPLFALESCSYSGGETLSLEIGAGLPWFGPLGSGGFYATGSAPDPVTTSGSTPGDGKANLPITGVITIDDNGTPADGSDDLISGTLVIGAGERVVSVSGGDAVEGFSSITHTIPATIVSSAVPNGDGGFDYVIGSAGFPLLLSGASDDYPSETASTATGDPTDFNYWDTANGGNIDVAAGPGPYTVEIVTYAPATGNVGPNIGVTTTAVAADLTCIAGDGTMATPDECDPDPDIGSATTWTVSGAQFDNLILQLSTNGAGNVASADAFYTQEYQIFPGTNPLGPDSFIGGTLSFGGSGGASAAADSASTLEGVAVNIDILANDSGFADPVTVTLPGAGVTASGGTVMINGTNPGAQAGIDVTYAPPAGFSGANDTFDYTVADAVASDTATVTVAVIAGGAVDDTVSTRLNTPVDIDLLANDSGFVDPVTVSLPGGGTTANGGTIVINGGNPGPQGGISVTYTPASGFFPGPDGFDYTVDDGVIPASTATVSVTIDNQVPNAPDASVETDQEQAVSIDVGTLAGVDFGDGTATVIVSSSPSNGSTTVSGTTIDYTPDNGFFGSDAFEYTIEDEDAEQATGTVTITVNQGEITIMIPNDGTSAIDPVSLVMLLLLWIRRFRRAIGIA
jgi:hypothetical protein